MSSTHLYKALVIEDEINGRLLIAQLLQTYFPQISSPAIAENTSEALTLLQTSHFDIIFSDSRMPFGNSMEILNHISDRRVQLILTTAYSKTETLPAGISLYYLQKPIDVDDFKKVVNHALQTLQLFDQSLKI